MKRRLPHFVLFVIVAALYIAGALAPIENALNDFRFRLSPRAASGDIVVIAIDTKSRRQLDVWPWPRNYHAALVDMLTAAGARTIAFDVDFSSRSTDEADTAFAAAIRRSGRVILPVFDQMMPGQGGEPEFVTTAPLKLLRESARLGHVNNRVEPDSRVRRHMGSVVLGETRLPSMAALVAGFDGSEPKPFYIDFGIEPSTIPKISYVDVLGGDFDPRAITGKTVIVGATAIELGDQIAVPVHRVIAGPVLQALIAESLVQGRTLSRSAKIPVLLVAFLLVMLLGTRFNDWTWRRGLIALVGWYGVAFGLSTVVQIHFSLTIDTTPWLLAPTFSYFFALARIIDRQTTSIFRERMVSLHRQAMVSAVVESSFDGIVVTDETGIIEMTNAQAEQMVGWEVGKAVGRSINDIMPPQGSGPFGGDLHARIETFDIDPILPHEVNIRHADGSTFAAELVITPSRMSISSQREKNENLERILRIYTFRDITVKRKAEEQKRERDDAIAANEAKSKFLANMSHELRTPMNGVMGMLGLILDTGLTNKQQEYARTAHDSANTLMTLLNDILDLSKLEAEKIELETIDFNLVRTLDQIVALLGARAQEKGIEIRSDVSVEIPQWLRGDQGRLRQIVFNLMGNAIKFTEQGSVTISASHRMCDDRSVELRCEIVDTGIGMSVADQRKLFSRFAQADGSISRKFGGTGLGLAICKQLVELMGGAIGVDSNPGEGSTFWFTIPCALGEPVDVSETESKSMASIETRPLRILVAEDNHVNQKVVGALLIGAGHSVDMVANGLEAVDAVAARSYDLVLMDVNMPEMDGIEASRRIRTKGGERKGIPIIALTASAMKGDKERFLAAGMNDYVSKPIDRVKLHQAIARQCGGNAEIDKSTHTNSNESPTEAQDELVGLMDTLDALIVATG